MAIRKNIIRVTLLLGMLLMLNACVVARAPGHHHAPPLHSHVHWWYYPDYELYYHPVDHYYYYYERGAWVRAHTLPWSITVHDSRHVRISISGLPYLRHSHHLRRYPPVRSNHRDRRDHRHRPDDNDRHGSDNGQRHRPDRDRKEGTNIFIPHTKRKNLKKTIEEGKEVDGDKSKRPLKVEKKQKNKKYNDKKKAKATNNVKNGDKRNGKWLKDEDDYDSGNGKNRKNGNQKRFFSR